MNNTEYIHMQTDTDPFYSENNIQYLNMVIDGIENGTRPLIEHDLIEVDMEDDSVVIAAVKGHYD